MCACKITILVDNLPSPEDAVLQSEHGLSMLIEVGEWRMLCDMGASPLYAVNAKHLQIDLQRLDAAFLSHGHADHSGGLGHFLLSFPDVPVWLSSHIQGCRYYSSRRGPIRDISTDTSLFQHYPKRFKWVDGSYWLTNDVALVCCSMNDYPSPHGNASLSVERNGQTIPDDFSHELSLAIRTSKGLIVVSSCSHRGALNILHACCQFTGEHRVLAFIGGLHLVDSHLAEAETKQFVTDFLQSFPDTLLYTGHCTGDIAKNTLCALLPNAHIFHTGMVMDFAD